MTKIYVSPKYGSVKPQGSYVYLHVRTTDGVIFYVGKGKGYRAWITSRKCNPRWTNTAKKHGVTVVIYKDKMNSGDAYKLEYAMLECISKSNNKLCNLTKGGDGNRGYKMSDEHRRKISASNKVTKSDLKNCRHDPAIRIFRHKCGDTFEGNRYEFYTKFNLSSGSVCKLINMQSKTVKGWSVDGLL